MRLSAILAVVLLAGCATGPTADQQAQQIAYHYMPECGGIPDNQTDGDRWRNCIKRAYERDQRAEAIGQAARTSALVDGMQQMNRNNQQTLQNMLPKPATNCTTQWLLGTAYTTCR